MRILTRTKAKAINQTAQQIRGRKKGRREEEEEEEEEEELSE
jgi:hypothetical protein